MGQEEMERLTVDLQAKNLPALGEKSVYRVGHWVTRGMDTPSMTARAAGPPTLFIFWRPVAMEAVERSLAEGVTLAIVPTRRVPPACLETRAKVTSKMNQILAELEADAMGSLSLMLDIHGNVAENSAANFFIVKGGVLWTAPAQNVLEGITRSVVFELSSQLKISFEGIFYHLQYDLRHTRSRGERDPPVVSSAGTCHETIDEGLCRRDGFGLASVPSRQSGIGEVPAYRQ
jgi:branched-subunit amino acid aminotransferase/4-amino-4-deoxychorismate lyase